MTIKAIIFDMDGLLVDSEPWWRSLSFLPEGTPRSGTPAIVVNQIVMATRPDNFHLANRINL